MNSRDETKVLVRSRKGRMVAGLCAGVADHFGIDVILVRVAMAVISIITVGMAVLVYLVAWAIIPEEGDNKSLAEHLVSHNQDSSSG